MSSIRLNKYVLVGLIAYLTLSWIAVGVIAFAGTNSQIDELQYDLVFRLRPPLSPRPADIDESAVAETFLLDTATWRTAPLNFGVGYTPAWSFSDQGSILGIAGSEYCLIDYLGQSQACINLSEGLLIRSYEWVDDELALWVSEYDTDTLHIRQLNFVDGATLNEISVAKEDLPTLDSTRSIPLYAISPELELAILSDYESIVYLLELSTGRLTTGELDSEGIWDVELSPDNRLIAVRTGYGFDSFLSILDLEGGLSQFHDFDSEAGLSLITKPIWSNDSSFIAFRAIIESDDGPTHATFVYELDSQEVRQIAAEQTEGDRLVWSPDDSAIAQVLCQMSLDGFTCGLSIVTLEGEEYTIVDRAEQRYIDSVLWVPHGQLAAD